MSKKLVSRSEFARLAGVTAAAVTKACSGVLKPATDGKRIDANHVVAQEYVRKRAEAQRPDPGPAPAPGIDPYYEQALVVYQANGGCSASRLRRELSIGAKRAAKLIATFEAVGVATSADETKPKPHARGHVVRNERKKRESPPPDPSAEPEEFPEDIQAFADMTLRELIRRFGTETRFKDWLAATKAIEDIEDKRIKNAEHRGRLISREVVKAGVIDTLDGAFTRMLTDGKRGIGVRAKKLIAAGATDAEVETMIEDQLTSFIRPTKSKIARVLRNA